MVCDLTAPNFSFRSQRWGSRVRAAVVRMRPGNPGYSGPEVSDSPASEPPRASGKPGAVQQEWVLRVCVTPHLSDEYPLDLGLFRGEGERRIRWILSL